MDHYCEKEVQNLIMGAQFNHNSDYGTVKLSHESGSPKMNLGELTSNVRALGVDPGTSFASAP